jgi:isoaspartyl peptidase/L-asparaginase-like protein (Ntn-hydrolase superfamily)
MTPKIIVHGGARNQDAEESKRLADVHAACEAAYEVLLQQSAVDAVEMAIHMIE